MKVYREIAIDKRRPTNWHSQLRTWVKRTEEHSPDCPACLRGRDHLLIEHERALKHAYAASGEV